MENRSLPIKNVNDVRFYGEGLNDVLSSYFVRSIDLKKICLYKDVARPRIYLGGCYCHLMTKTLLQIAMLATSKRAPSKLRGAKSEIWAEYFSL